MIQLIAPEFQNVFSEDIEAMQRLRYRVFNDRLGWEVSTDHGREVDVFDDLKPHYLLLRGEYGRVDGCVRLLPSTGPNMLRDVFPILLDGKDAPNQPDIWESSRFALDIREGSAGGPGGLAEGTYELFAGVLEFGLAKDLKRIVTVTDVRMERILRRAGWHVERLGEPKEIGSTRAVAGYLEISQGTLESVRSAGGLSAPVLWVPLMPAAA